MELWCGIDWADRHHDVALVNDVCAGSSPGTDR